MSAAGDAGLVSVEERVAAVRERVAQACAHAGRARDEVTVVAVGKTHPPHLLLQAVRAGIGDLGENRVQELVAKADLVPEARWHVIGPLQRNKAASAVGIAHLVHTVDRERLARTLDRHAADQGRQLDVLLQVNVGRDPAKHGTTTAEAPALADLVAGLDHLRLRGLMTVPPLPADGADPATEARPHFARLRELRDRMAGDHPGLEELSMGMTGDLEAAVAEGATIVRLGTAVFGPRGARPWTG